jgi:hypothetical protein
MKKYIIRISAILVLNLVLLMAGCARSVTLDAAVTRDYNIRDFSYLEVGHTNEWMVFGGVIDVPVDVTVTRSDAYQLSITANANIFDYIDVSSSGKTLKIAINRLKIASEAATLKIAIGAPDLAGISVTDVNMTAKVASSAPEFAAEVSDTGWLDIEMQNGNTRLKVRSSSTAIAHGSAGDFTAEVSGASTLDINNLQTGSTTLHASSSSGVTHTGITQDYNVELSGASNLHLDVQAQKVSLEASSSSYCSGQLKSADIGITLSGASRASLKGSGGNGTIKASSSSNISMPDFTLSSAVIDLSGASNGDVTVNGKLSVELSSSSSLTYGGDPVLENVGVNGASTISKR